MQVKQQTCTLTESSFSLYSCMPRGKLHSLVSPTVSKLRSFLLCSKPILRSPPFPVQQILSSSPAFELWNMQTAVLTFMYLTEGMLFSCWLHSFGSFALVQQISELQFWKISLGSFSKNNCYQIDLLVALGFLFLSLVWCLTSWGFSAGAALTVTK